MGLHKVLLIRLFHRPVHILPKESACNFYKSRRFIIIKDKFKSWKPKAPVVTERTKCSITMEWMQNEPFQFLQDQLLYRIEMKKKLPAWVTVYSGGKTTKMIDYLPPRHPHVFRLKVILTSTAVPQLAEKAIQFFGDKLTILEKLGGTYNEKRCREESLIDNEEGDATEGKSNVLDEKSDDKMVAPRHRWLESQPSEETWTNTDTDGTSAVCFCMAVCCGYIKQVQSMLEERPELVSIVNPTNGFTPLACAVKKGDLNIVKFLLSAGAEVEQRSATGQTPLHLALLAADMPMVALLIENGADLKTRDVNQLRAEHYVADSGSVGMLRFVLDHGGDLDVRDSNGWTPLFRVLTQNGRTDMIVELVARGSDVEISDAAGLPLLSVARLLTNRLGRSRDSVLRVVDRNFPHERALAMFTRLTKKIHHVHTVFR